MFPFYFLINVSRAMYCRLGKSQPPHVLLFSRNGGCQLRPAPILRLPGPRVITDFSRPYNIYFRTNSYLVINKQKDELITPVITHLYYTIEFDSVAALSVPFQYHQNRYSFSFCRTRCKNISESHNCVKIG
jgi:hypothetical protein